jgi:predicted ABC-type ATPase
MFAGPNGSGKSTIRTLVPSGLLGIYINPDEIEARLASIGQLDFGDFSVQASLPELSAFLATSSLLERAGLQSLTSTVSMSGDTLCIPPSQVNSYVASVIADFCRQKLIASRTSFTFETVMSSPDKIELLRKARLEGFRTYLYFIATEDPTINISRVGNRVRLGGHSVPEDKIVSRYARSLDLLIDAIGCSDRAYLFDNSGSEQIWIAEITGGRQLEIKVDRAPIWFQTAVMNKIHPTEADHSPHSGP